ncbi:MAG: hypothetical protein SH820_00720 [Xanthomonadales bacterium]|nr:hypothetical protein [Xanthomonadales bacterium]
MLMTIQCALEFIKKIRADLACQTDAKLSPNYQSLNDLIEHAKTQGLEFSEHDLRLAFVYDWNMRWQSLGKD